MNWFEIVTCSEKGACLQGPFLGGGQKMGFFESCLFRAKLENARNLMSINLRMADDVHERLESDS